MESCANAAHRSRTIEESGVQKCVTCQFYDRRNTERSDGKGPSWGQCRRFAPALHPVNVKSYMIEGVWPHTRDDDWCGEWKILARRPEARPVDLTSTRLAPTPDDAPRVSPLSPLPGPVPERAVAHATARMAGASD
jgi:hypothetical protein